MDTVFISDLRIPTVIGVRPWERQVSQTVRLELEMAFDIRAAAATDDLNDALDYKAVADRLKEFVGDSRFQLVETLAEQVAALVMSEFAVPWVRLTVSKPAAVSAARAVGITVERGARPAGP